MIPICAPLPVTTRIVTVFPNSKVGTGLIELHPSLGGFAETGLHDALLGKRSVIPFWRQQ